MNPKVIAMSIILATGSVGAQKAPADPVEMILKQALVAEAMAPAKNFIKNKINSQFANKLASTAGSKAMADAGTTTFALVDFGMAVDDFSKAETDKERTYAGARATGAVLTIVAPPVGAIVSLAVAGAALAEALLSVGWAEDMMRLQALINEHYKVINNVMTSFAKADIATLQAISDMTEEATLSVKKLKEQLSANCSDQRKLANSDLVNTCIDNIMNISAGQKAIVRLTSSLLEARLNILDKKSFFQENNVPIEYFEKKLVEKRREVEEFDLEIQKTLSVYAKSLHESILATAKRDALPTFQEQFVNLCINRALDLIQNGALIYRFGNNLPLEIVPLAKAISKEIYLQRVADFKAESCQENADPLQPRFQIMTKNLNWLDQIEDKVAAK